MTFNGSTYTVPATSDANWGTNVSNYLIAIASGSLQKTGGTFTLTAETDFGASYGLKSLYYKSRGTNVSATGIIRLANAESIGWRNAANGADLALTVNASDALQYNGSTLLNTAGLALLIDNSMVSNSAAIAYSKLSLSNSILNADINASAAIALSKLAPLTTSRVLQSNSSTGAIEASSVTNTTLAFLDATSSVQTQLDAKIAKTTTTTTGDMLYASSANTPARLPIGSSGQVIKSVGGIPTWATFSGGVNYLSSNPDAEADTSGWSTYADAAAATPVDGTGGAPSSTWTRSTTTPLRGSASFLWTKTAVNRQGEGVSYDFTIDSTDQAKVIAVTFDYKVASGTYADSGLTVYIYDVTNATVIQPAGYSIVSASVSMKQTATFQTASNSTSYRLIIHTASTSAVAYTMQFDNFNVSPQAVAAGAAISDWNEYTLVIGGSTTAPTTGTVSVNKAFWRRVGDSAEVMYEYFQTALGSAANGSGTYLFPLPSGLVVNTSKIAISTDGNITANVGSASGFATAGSALTGGVGVYNTTNLILTLGNEASNPSTVGSAFMGMAQINITYKFNAKVPIVGWSSNVQMSNDTDTRVISFNGTQTTQAVTANVTNIAFTSSIDRAGAWNGTQYVVPAAGDYVISGSGVMSVAATTIVPYLNGTATSALFSTAAAIGSASSGSALILGCRAGDLLSLRSNTTLTITVGAIQVFRLSGPATIAATESISALYTGAPPTGTLAAAYNTTTFATKVKDTHNAYSSGSYTVPVSGCYDISATARQNATYALGSTIAIAVFVDGVQKASNVLIAAAAIGSAHPSVNVRSLPLLAGQVVTIRCYNGGTTPTFTSAADENYFSITRTGNY